MIPLFSMIFVMMTAVLSGVIIETRDLTPVSEACTDLDSNALVLFDVDATLICPKDKILFLITDKELFPARTISHHLQDADKSFQQHYGSLMMQQCHWKPVDPCSLDIINSLQKRGIRTLAFTAAVTGQYGVIPDMTEWRIAQLKKLGFDFTLAFPELSYLPFKTESQSLNPCFKQGILFTAFIPKGDILKIFLYNLNWKPSKIVFVDDNLDFVQSVDHVMTGLGYDITCFYYRAIEEMKVEIDMELAAFQLFYLLENEVWLSDEEAIALCTSFTSHQN